MEPNPPTTISASPHSATPAGVIFDSDGHNLLTAGSTVWAGATPDLRQPDPAP